METALPISVRAVFGLGGAPAGVFLRSIALGPVGVGEVLLGDFCLLGRLCRGSLS